MGRGGRLTTRYNPAMPNQPDQYQLACDANDAYRRSRMNVKYYGCRLVSLQRRNRAMEIIIAVGTSGTVAALSLWNYPNGKTILGILAGAAAILSLAKPIIDLSSEIARCSKMWAAYNGLEATFERITRDMRINNDIRPEIASAIGTALDTYASLANNEDPNPDRKLLQRAKDEAAAELPKKHLWWPEGCDEPISAVEAGAKDDRTVSAPATAGAPGYGQAAVGARE